MIYTDAEKKPNAFQLTPLTFSSEWEKLEPPLDLVELWEKLGVGEVFETETIHSPTRGVDNDDIVKTTERYSAKGLDATLIIFHTGLVVSAYRKGSSGYLVLDEETLMPIREYATLDEWYCGELRSEYAERYGLDCYGNPF